MMKRILDAACIAFVVLCIVLLIKPEEPELQAPAASTAPSTTISTQVSTAPVTTPPSAAPTTVPSTVPPATTAPTTQAPTAPVVMPQSPYCFVYDTASDWLVFSQGDAQARVYPASLTKVFTAYVALQILEPDTAVTVGQEVNIIHPLSSRAMIAPGNQLTVEMLVQGMLLPSGNDAAYALAVAAGYALLGSREFPWQSALARFMEEVNATAQALGLTGTHYSVPDGIHKNDHYTTPADLLQMARLAMENPIIAQYAAQSSAEVTFLSGEKRTWVNTNALLHPDSGYYCPDCIGLKTGYEDLAGHCLLSVFPTEDGLRITLVLRAPSSDIRFQDSRWLYEQYIME